MLGLVLASKNSRDNLSNDYSYKRRPLLISTVLHPRLVPFFPALPVPRVKRILTTVAQWERHAARFCSWRMQSLALLSFCLLLFSFFLCPRPPPPPAPRPREQKEEIINNAHARSNNSVFLSSHFRVSAFLLRRGFSKKSDLDLGLGWWELPEHESYQARLQGGGSGIGRTYPSAPLFVGVQSEAENQASLEHFFWGNRGGLWVDKVGPRLSGLANGPRGLSMG